MPKISMWRNQRGNNYRFLDFHSKQQFDIGGTQVFVHKYLGPIEQGDVTTEIRPTGDFSQPNYLDRDTGMPWDGKSNETDIQDLLYLENRDRKYSPDVYELRGAYSVSDNDFDLKQFGWFLTSDNIVIGFHFNDMVAKLGRKLMSGDVLELPHLRDQDTLGDQDKPAINKYYVVEDGQRGADGFDQHWNFHTWRCRCSPMKNQQEFLEILERSALDVNGDETPYSVEQVASTLPKDLEISTAIDEEANRQIPFRNYAHYHLYVVPNTIDPENGEVIAYSSDKYPLLFNYGDGIPPNGAQLVGSGTSFPDSANEGDFFLRTDYQPNVLFLRKRDYWHREEIDYRSKWSAAHDALRSLINRTDRMRYQETSEKIPQRQYLSKVLKPKTDL